MLEVVHVGGGVRQLERAVLAPVAVDRLLGDQPANEVEGVERVPVERGAGLVAVAAEQVGRAPLVAGVDDAAVPG